MDSEHPPEMPETVASVVENFETLAEFESAFETIEDVEEDPDAD